MTRCKVLFQVNLVGGEVSAHVTLDRHVVELVVDVLLQHIFFQERCCKKGRRGCFFFFFEVDTQRFFNINCNISEIRYLIWEAATK